MGMHYHFIAGFPALWEQRVATQQPRPFLPSDMDLSGVSQTRLGDTARLLNAPLCGAPAFDAVNRMLCGDLFLYFVGYFVVSGNMCRQQREIVSGMLIP